VSGKQSRRARALAHAEAERQGLWKKGEAGVFAKWWRRLLARFFPRLRRRYLDAVGRWYKRTLKVWQKIAYEHRPGSRQGEIDAAEARSLARAQRISRRCRMIERQKAAM
jgi:hypothetical protein